MTSLDRLSHLKWFSGEKKCFFPLNHNDIVVYSFRAKFHVKVLPRQGSNWLPTYCLNDPPLEESGRSKGGRDVIAGTDRTSQSQSMRDVAAMTSCPLLDPLSSS